MEDKGHNIQVSVDPDSNGVTFHATYTIRGGAEKVVTATIAGGLKHVVDAEIQAYLAARRWVNENTWASHAKGENPVSLRTLNGALTGLLLTEAQVANTFLDVASTTRDERRRERNLQAAFDMLKNIDEYMLNIDIDGAVLKARDSLAQRLRELGCRGCVKNLSHFCWR